MAIINGRRIDPNSIPQGGVHGRELTGHAQAGSGRRPILEVGGKVQEIQDRYYQKHELIDKKGRGAKVTSMPDRSKGHTFGGFRAGLSKRIITEQVVAVAEHLFRQGVDFDEDNADWMVVPNYYLPVRWHRIARNTPLLVVFPNEYPRLSPVGFYMRADIPCSPDGHFFDFVAHQAWQEPIQHGWKWYCCYVHQGAWQPTQRWQEGDNLFTYFRLVNEVLGN